MRACGFPHKPHLPKLHPCMGRYWRRGQFCPQGRTLCPALCYFLFLFHATTTLNSPSSRCTCPIFPVAFISSTTLWRETCALMRTDSSCALRGSLPAALCWRTIAIASLRHLQISSLFLLSSEASASGQRERCTLFAPLPPLPANI